MVSHGRSRRYCGAGVTLRVQIEWLLPARRHPLVRFREHLARFVPRG